MAKTLTERFAGNILEKDIFLRISNTPDKYKIYCKGRTARHEFKTAPYILIRMAAGENVAIFRGDIEEVHRVYEWILKFF